jgi:uncharacterized membrane protein
MENRKPIPAGAMIVAIMNLVLFVPCLCLTGGSFALKASGGLSGLQAAPEQKEIQQKVEDAIARELPNAKTVDLVSSVVTVLFSIGMIVSAIGLLTRQTWGRTLCLFLSVLLVILAAASTYYAVTVTLPVTDKITEEALKAQKLPISPGMAQTISYGFVAVLALFEIGYPILAVALLMTPGVRRMYCSHPSAGVGDSMNDDRRREDYDSR